MVKIILHTALLILAVLASSGCNELPLQAFFVPTSATVETRFGNSILWNEGHGDHLSLTVPTDDYSVYVCGDIHIEKTTVNTDLFLQAELNDPNACFSIFLGDIIKDKESMPILYDALYSKPVDYDPFFPIAGNHDLYFNLWETFYKLFGSSTYAVSVDTPHYTDLYVFLDNAGGTFGASQLKWLKNLLSSEKEKYRHCVVSAHVNIFRKDRPLCATANIPLEETFALADILSENNVELMLQGHEHERGSVNFLGVEYLVLDALADWYATPSYVILKVGDGLSYDFIEIK